MVFTAKYLNQHRVWLTVHSSMGGIFWERQLLKIMCPSALQSLHMGVYCWWWDELKMLTAKTPPTDLSSLSWWLLFHLTTQELDQRCLTLKAQVAIASRKWKFCIWGCYNACSQWIMYRVRFVLQTWPGFAYTSHRVINDSMGCLPFLIGLELFYPEAYQEIL